MSSSLQSPSHRCILILVLSVLVFFPCLLAHAATRPLFHLSKADGRNGWRGRKVGGRTELTGVEHNEEVQALGRFAVEEHNKRVLPSAAEHLLKFRKVERAHSQVVAGIKYYLTIAVGGGAGRYEAEIVVRAWENSRELVSFTPAADGERMHGGIVNDGVGYGGPVQV